MLEWTGFEILTWKPTMGVTGKGRPKFTTRGGYAKAYSPKKTVDAEKELADLWEKEIGLGHADHCGPVRITITVHRELPKSAPKRRIGEPDIKKPDLDNVLKLIGDALNGVAYKDDAQIDEARIKKLHRLEHGSGDTVLIVVDYFEEKE